MTATAAPTASASAARADRLGGLWPRPRPAVIGVVNCTPDSFSDGGAYLELGDAVDLGEAHFAAGAAVVDVGGESTRPGAHPVGADEEKRRVVPVVRELRRRHPQGLLSVDTSKAEVAAAALAAGADIVNDVTAGSDRGMLELVAAERATVVLMHMRGTPRTMQRNTTYGDVVAEVHQALAGYAEAALAAGIAAERVWLDPGIGFGKDDDGNLALLAALPALAALGHPVVVGPSRKSFIGRLTGAPVAARLPGTLAALIPALELERVLLRVHEPAPVLQFVEIARRLAEVAR